MRQTLYDVMAVSSSILLNSNLIMPLTMRDRFDAIFQNRVASIYLITRRMGRNHPMRFKNKSRNHRRFWGLILITTGTLFFFESIGIFEMGDFISSFWPVVLIGLGLLIIFTSKERDTSQGKHVHHLHIGDREVRNDSERVAMSHIFGDVKITIHSESFEGGNISTIFGDIVVDFSESDIRSNDSTLTLRTVFGDTKVTPPRSVAFSMRGSRVAGDITVSQNTQSGLFPKPDYTSDGFDQVPKRLQMYASHVFGDIIVT